jgi:hypothetical protein
VVTEFENEKAVKVRDRTLALGDRTHPRPIRSILVVEALLAEGEK